MNVEYQERLVFILEHEEISDEWQMISRLYNMCNKPGFRNEWKDLKAHIAERYNCLANFFVEPNNNANVKS